MTCMFAQWFTHAYIHVIRSKRNIQIYSKCLYYAALHCTYLAQSSLPQRSQNGSLPELTIVGQFLLQYHNVTLVPIAINTVVIPENIHGILNYKYGYSTLPHYQLVVVDRWHIS